MVGRMESIHKEEHVDMPSLQADIETNEQLYGYTASVMEVKMQSGRTKEEPTLPALHHTSPAEV